MTGISSPGLSQEGDNAVLEINDPLTLSQTVGVRNGGTFTAQGWKTSTHFDYIQYNISTCASGEIQFDIQGLYASSQVFNNASYDKQWNVIPGETDIDHSFLSMYDRDDSNLWYGQTQWLNPYKCIMHVNGYDANNLDKWGKMKLHLNVAAYSGGYEDDPHAFENPAIGSFDWQRTHVYHHRLVWGNGHMSWYQDDVLIKDWDYSSFGEEYAPPNQSIRLGSGLTTKGSAGFKAPLAVTLKNFKFYRYEDAVPPQVLSAEPAMVEGGVNIDSDILVHFSEPMDSASVASAFSLEPAVPGSLRWVGSWLYFDKSALLNPNTMYTIHIATGARDKANHPLTEAFEYHFSTTSSVPATVARYEEVEIPLVAGSTGALNRYKDVWLKGIFHGPTKTIEIEGFWDGGDVWKVRMVPTEVGVWTYTISGSEASFTTTGSFTCVDSDAKGFIRVNPDNPYTFMYEDGTPWLWRGETSWRGFTSLVTLEGRWKPFIDLRASQGYTAVQSIVVSYIGGMDFWKNEGGLCFAENADSKDYDHLNPEYFRWIDKRLDYAISKGIIPVILFTWAQEYPNFTTSQFEKFERYLVARYAAKNVIWCLCGEYDEIPVDFGIPTSVFNNHGQIVRQYDPYDHLITLHPTGEGTSAEFAGQSWFDFIMQQTTNFAPDIQRDRRYNKPVVNAELRYMYTDEDNTESRYGHWEVTATGGFYTAGFIPTFAPDKGGWDLAALPDEQRWVSFLNEYMSRLRWWEMQPHAEWISSGHLISKPGESYLAYKRSGGPVTINLSGYLGSLPAKWINPNEASVVQEFQVQLGSPTLFTPPFTGDWALFIGHGIPTDTIPPLAPTGLAMESHTSRTITLRWNAAPTASDGDDAVKYILYCNGALVDSTQQTSILSTGLQEDTEYSYQVYALDDAANVSTEAAEGSFSTLADLEPPLLTDVTPIALDTLVAVFSETIDSLTATDEDNYKILQGIQVLSAALLHDHRSVRLKTGLHQEGLYYTLIARQIQDRSAEGNVLGPNNYKSYRFGETFEISSIAPSNYSQDYLHIGDYYYLDRDYTLESIPIDYQGLMWLRTRNDDKMLATNNFLSFAINTPATIYVGYDTGIAAVPAWLSSWTNTGDQILTSDDMPFSIYSKAFAEGSVTLGANYGDSHSSMYIVLLRQSLPSDLAQPGAPVNVRAINN